MNRILQLPRRARLWVFDLRRTLTLRFLLTVNRALGRHGQNAYCKKSDVKMLVAALGMRWRDNPDAKETWED